jgi:hypothetical protein
MREKDKDREREREREGGRGRERGGDEGEDGGERTARKHIAPVVPFFRLSSLVSSLASFLMAG